MPADGRDEDVADTEEVSVADIIEEAEPGGTAADTEGRPEAGETDRIADGHADVTVASVPPAETGDEDDAVAGSFAPDVAVRPQRPAPENTLFVALGVYLTILALAQTLPGVGVAPTTLLLVTVAVAVGTLACYGVLVRTTPDT